MTESARTIFVTVLVSTLISAHPAVAADKPGIAVFSGGTATIQNSEPLVTSNKARTLHGLPLMTNADGTPVKYDHLMPQRLAAPVEVFIEAHSAHPLENDVAELYAPPDGYLDSTGRFHEQRSATEDKPVYRVTLRPEDGLYMLPYMARQADGSAWEDDCASPGAPAEQCRQPFFPDASRIFEEIDRGIWGVGEDGRGNMLSSKADFDFYRILPSAGYTKGLAESKRTDMGSGDIPPEVHGRDFFAYKPWHLASSVRYDDLARATNAIQQAMDTGAYAGAIWLEGSPRVEETLYWLHLLIDTTVPIVGNAAQRANRALSADGPGNLVDSVDYIVSKVWADAEGRDELGGVVIQDEQIFAARQVQKSDARPGGYVATGDHGGILGTIGKPGPVTMYFKPLSRHTWNSMVNLHQLPVSVKGVRQQRRGQLQSLDVRIKDDAGLLLGDAIPRVHIVGQGHYSQSSSDADPMDEVDIISRIERNLAENPLAGFVATGTAPYGGMNVAQTRALELAVFHGMPVVRVGRGNAGGLTPASPNDVFIEGNNLTATKARLLLKAALLKFGSLPYAKDPQKPTAAEVGQIKAAVARFQEVFDTH